MSQCATHAATTAHQPDTVTLHVEDMTCGHCASTVRQAIEASFASAQVEADPGARRVTVSGIDDPARLREVVRAAGFTPSEMPVA